jgi:hypothetical protein
LVQEAHFRVLEAWTLARLGEAERLRGNPGQAAELAGRALTLADQGPFPLQRALAERCLGRVALGTGKAEVAAARLAQVIETLDGMHARYDAAITRLDLADAWRGLGDQAAAATLAHRARRDFVAMNAPELARRAETLLNALGVPVIKADEQAYYLLDREFTGFGLAGRPLSRFVGRERELDTLAEIFRRAVDGRGQAVGILGEPGSGKSRLVYEFRRSLSPDACICLEGWCTSHGMRIPYSLFADVLQRAWRLEEAQDSDDFQARLARALSGLGLASDELMPWVQILLRLPSSETGHSPEDVRTRALRAITEILLAHAQARPLVLLLEDVHWIDRASADFLASFTDTLAGCRVLVVATYRPGYRPSWLGHSHVSQLALVPLSDEASLTVIRSVTPGEAIPTSREREIVHRGEGNPFFLEELAWAALDNIQPKAVPATVEATLTARMDGLPPAARRVLEATAILGREIPDWILPALCEDVDLPGCLSDLVRLDFLYPRPGLGHVFKHALIQEVAYERSSPAERQQRPTRAGDRVRLACGRSGRPAPRQHRGRHLLRAGAGSRRRPDVAIRAGGRDRCRGQVGRGGRQPP